MPVTADRPAPYATPSAIIDLIGRYRSRGLPSPVTAEVLSRAGIAETLVPRTLQSLQTLDLIDSETGAPTPTLEGLRLAPEGEFKNRMADWLKSAYSDVFAYVDLSKDDETQIRDAFRSYTPFGQQERMVMLFKELCIAAGLIEKQPTPRAVTKLRAIAAPAPKRAAASSSPSAKNLAKAANLANLHGSPGVPAPLAGLLTSLPSPDDGWTDDERKKFLATFTTVLDFCIPVVKLSPEKKVTATMT